MGDSLLASYRRFFGIHRWAARHLGRFPGAFDLVATAGTLVYPARKPAPHTLDWPDGCWRRYVRTKCIATALMYRLRDLPKIANIRWHDPDGVLETAKRSGGPILTYHHPFAYHFPALLGHAGVALDVLALSPEESPLYPLYDEYVADWFADCESLQHGGKWFFLYSTRPNSMRTPLQNLKQGRALISLHDFPNFYKDARTRQALLLGRKFEVAEGIIGPACRMAMPISAGYIEWQGGNDLLVTLFSLNANGAEALTPDEVLARYLAKLEKIVTQTPDFWEMWPSLPPPAPVG